MIIALVPIGRIPVDVLQSLQAELRAAFTHEVQIAPALGLPPAAYDAGRGQMQIHPLLDELAEIRQPDWDIVLGVTDVDLFDPGHDSVIGHADAGRHVAVFSLERLHSSDAVRYRTRAAAAAVRVLREAH